MIHLKEEISSLLENTPVNPVKAGQLFEAASQLREVPELHALIREDVLKRAYVFEDDSHPFNAEKPFIVYSPMNREPELGLGIAVMRLGLLELRIPADEEFFVMMAPNSSTWMLRTLEHIRPEFPGIRPLLATKNTKEASLWAASGVEVAEIGVSSYTRGRIRGEEGVETVYVRGLNCVRGKRLVVVDDALAEGKTALDLGEGIRAYEPSELDLIATLSKRIQGGYDRCVASGLFSGIFEAIPIQDILVGPNGEKQLVLLGEAN